MQTDKVENAAAAAVNRVVDIWFNLVRLTGGNLDALCLMVTRIILISLKIAVVRYKIYSVKWQSKQCERATYT